VIGGIIGSIGLDSSSARFSPCWQLKVKLRRMAKGRIMSDFFT
jgi:hypothetical protein